MCFVQMDSYDAHVTEPMYFYSKNDDTCVILIKLGKIV